MGFPSGHGMGEVRWYFGAQFHGQPPGIFGGLFGCLVGGRGVPCSCLIPLGAQKYTRYIRVNGVLDSNRSRVFPSSRQSSLN